MAVKSAATNEARPSNERSEELLVAACRMIARGGSRKLSLRDVAEEAGVSKALIHYYFSSRNDLLARAYEFSDARGRQRVSADVAGVESGAVRLSRLLDLYLADDPAMEEDWVLWSELSSTAMFERDLRPVMERAFERWIDWIRTLVLDAIDEGSIASGADADEITLHIVALTDGLGALLGRGLIDRDAARNVLTRHVDTELGRSSAASSVSDARAEAPATGYLRILAQLTLTAVEELQGLASSAEERTAIQTVTALIGSRAAQGGAAGVGVAQPLTSAPAARSATNVVVRGTPVDAIPTPAVVVELDRFERNLRSFADAMADRGVAFRPHAKAHKSPATAARQLALGAVGLAVAKPSEAEVFWCAGCRNIAIAYPVVGREKCDRIARMAGEGRIAVNVDSEIAARDMSAAAVAAGSSIRVQIEIDTGLHRSGLAPDDLVSIERLSRLVADLPGLEFDGLTSYRGLGFDRQADRERAGIEEGQLMSRVAAELRTLGLEVNAVVAGSTATAAGVAAVDGITEVRAGVYPFMDGAQVTAGTATSDDVALWVVCTVVSLSDSGRVTVDGGSKTFSANGPAIDGAYAISKDGRVRLERLTEEHGVGRVVDDSVRVSVGERLTFMPSYASSVVGLADNLIVVNNGVAEEVWPVSARGAST